MKNPENPLARARLRRGLSLEQVGARALLSARVLRLLDEGRFSELPGGLYARGYVRAYASAVDLDPTQTVDQLAPQLPIAEDPILRMREIARADDPGWVIALEDAGASITAWADAMKAGLRTHTPTRSALRNAALDGSILVALQAAVIGLTAWMCAVRVQSLLTSEGLALAAVWGVQVSLYLLLAARIRQVRSGVVFRIKQIRLTDAVSFALHQSRHA